LGLLGPPPPPPPPVGLKLPGPSKLAVSGFISRGDWGPIELMVRLFSRLRPETIDIFTVLFWIDTVMVSHT
jgi:hypothetical protein